MSNNLVIVRIEPKEIEKNYTGENEKKSDMYQIWEKREKKNLPNAPINMAIVLCSEMEWNKNEWCEPSIIKLTVFLV